MFAAPVARPKSKSAAPSKNTSLVQRAAPFGLRSQRQSFDAAVRPDHDRARAPAVSWSFADIPINSRSSAATSPTQTRSFTATLRAIVKGRQSDSLSADRRPPGESEPRVSQSAVSEPRESKLQREGGEPIPNGALPSISGEQADSITSHLNYISSISNNGPPPSDFGITRYVFTGENFSITPHPGASGNSAGSGSPSTPATPAWYEVAGDIRGAITYQVTNSGPLRPRGRRRRGRSMPHARAVPGCHPRRPSR
jgi:hypothetical protein